MFEAAATAVPAPLAGVDAASAFFHASLLFAGNVDPLAGEEVLWVAHLDEAAYCLHLQSYPLGAGASVLPARAILSDAARLGAAGLLLAHRQRDADPPRPAERAATRLRAAAASACGLTLVDHLVFGSDGCTSMRRVGVL